LRTGFPRKRLFLPRGFVWIAALVSFALEIFVLRIAISNDLSFEQSPTV